MPEFGTKRSILRIDAAGLADADRSIEGPVSIWVDRPVQPKHPHQGAGGGVVLRIGRPGGPVYGAEGQHLADQPEPRADELLDRTDSVLIPGLVNAHTHLDLTSIGPQPHDPGSGFVPWVRMVRDRRPIEPTEIQAAVKAGVQKSLAGGVVAVGDILGAAQGRPTMAGLAALAESPLSGIGYVEYFGIGSRAQPGIAALDSLIHELAAWPASASIRPGLHPHAPNTVSLSLYEATAQIASRDEIPVSTHLAETPEERQFIADAEGPQRHLLEDLGIWDDAELAHIGSGAHPVAHLADFLTSASVHAPVLVAHVNDATDEAIEILERSNTSVAYCPRASSYFGAPSRLGPHRFAAMLDAGVNVCLGTDSIINLETPDRISPLDDARLLAHSTDTTPRRLLAMMTIHGARALGLEPRRFVFRAGFEIAGVVAVPVSDVEAGGVSDPAKAVLDGHMPPELLFC